MKRIQQVTDCPLLSGRALNLKCFAEVQPVHFKSCYPLSFVCVCEVLFEPQSMTRDCCGILLYEMFRAQGFFTVFILVKPNGANLS